MLRPLLIAAALVATTSPALAQSGHYRATLATAPAKASIITRDVMWRCTDTVCVAGRSATRDAILCELVAQNAGALTDFSAGATRFDADALAKCNARAK